METGSTSERKSTRRSTCRGTRLEVEIADEGAGFDPRGVGDPLNPTNLMKTSGRGIFYMRTFMDSVDFVFSPAGGTRLIMIKNLNGTPKQS